MPQYFKTLTPIWKAFPVSGVFSENVGPNLYFRHYFFGTWQLHVKKKLQMPKSMMGKRKALSKANVPLCSTQTKTPRYDPKMCHSSLTVNSQPLLASSFNRRLCRGRALLIDACLQHYWLKFQIKNYKSKKEFAYRMCTWCGVMQTSDVPTSGELWCLPRLPPCLPHLSKRHDSSKSAAPIGRTTKHASVLVLACGSAPFNVALQTNTSQSQILRLTELHVCRGRHWQIVYSCRK